MYTFIVVSLLTFPIDTFQGLPSSVRDALYIAEMVIVAVFSVEYLLRLFLAERKRDYALSFLGIVDLLAILPFYLAVFLAGDVDGRILRTIRLIRLIRIFKLVRYINALERLRKALLIAREEIIAFLGLAFFLIYVSAAGIWYFESEVQPENIGSVFDGFWWAIITLTTVGYGDVYPITTGGRIFTIMMLIVGLGVISIPTGIFASALTRARNESGGDAGNEGVSRQRGRMPGIDKERT